MPLSQPASRQHLHTRDITCKGYLREDGLWDIEGHLHDSKTYPFSNDWRGEVAPGMPVHEMAMRLTVDEDFRIHAVEAVTDASPYRICPDVLPNFQRLVGQQIGRGWRRKVRELLGGVEGCTHLVELLGPLATVAFQSIRPYQRHRLKQNLEEGASDPTNKRPHQLNTCHGWSEKGEVVKRWMPEFYTGDDAPARESEGA